MGFVVENGVLKKFRPSLFQKKAVIPDGVTVIGECAFGGCTGLREVEIPESVQVIEPYAFVRCKSLETIQIPKGVRKICTHAFLGCSKMRSVQMIGGGEVECNAFDGCGIMVMTMTENVRFVGREPLKKCYSLGLVNIFPADDEVFKSYHFSNFELGDYDFLELRETDLKSKGTTISEMISIISNRLVPTEAVFGAKQQIFMDFVCMTRNQEALKNFEKYDASFFFPLIDEENMKYLKVVFNCRYVEFPRECIKTLEMYAREHENRGGSSQPLNLLLWYKGRHGYYDELPDSLRQRRNILEQFPAIGELLEQFNIPDNSVTVEDRKERKKKVVNMIVEKPYGW